MQQRKVLKVSELTQDIKLVLENTFDLVWVEGEISNLRAPSSGHIYFTLKDESSQVKCVLFRLQAQNLKFKLEDGLNVIVFARLGVYERDGQYQLYVNLAEPKGKGALHLAFEQLKTRLSQEGLFDAAHKKPLPFLPQAIGLITSATGAVIQDMLYVLNRRFNNFKVIIYPVKVQGEGSKEEIVEAIEYFNFQINVDVIILARGGGSIEDLWPFNEEIVARSIYNSGIPIISAIGHETDFTIADFVSDERSPTPSRAAERVIPQKEELYRKIEDLSEDLRRSLADIIPQHRQRIDDLREDLSRALEVLLKERKAKFQSNVERLEALSPLNVLKRGYSITLKLPQELSIKDCVDLKIGDCVKTKLEQGSFLSRVEEVLSNGRN